MLYKNQDLSSATCSQGGFMKHYDLIPVLIKKTETLFDPVGTVLGMLLLQTSVLITTKLQHV